MTARCINGVLYVAGGQLFDAYRLIVKIADRLLQFARSPITHQLAHDGRQGVPAYQIRNALKARNASGDTAPVNFGPFELAYQALTEKLQPQVFSLGFLR